MFLSQLKVNGFKSFAQKTHLDFSKGITCIIGPNGCGKSNIVDAIRWVIGEQKVGTLRSEKMIDVIFNGSKKRKALGMAEVSLTVQNDYGILPTEYEEVVLTRRVYRDGQSEYLLNNQICRLKDIQDLFIDSGMGADAYSVIELKMVDQILSQNNLERRLLFEEAAGIKKYKQRRKSARRKLDDTKQSLLRIEDIMEELSNKVSSLNKQVKKVVKYQDLKKSLEKLDLQAAAFNFQKLQERIKPLVEQLETNKSGQEKNSNQLNLDESLIEKYKLELLEVEATLSECRKEIFNLDKRSHLINDDELLFSEKLKHSNELIMRLKNEIQKIENQKEKATQVIRKKQRELKTFQSELDSASAFQQKSEKEINQLKEATEQIGNEISKNDTTYQILREEINVLTQKINQLRFKKSEFQERLTESKAHKPFDPNYYINSIILAEKKLSAYKKDNKEKELEAVKKRRQQINEKLTQLKKNKTEIDKTFMSLESRRNVIKDTLLSGKMLPETVQFFLQSSNNYNNYLGILSDLIRIDDAKISSLEFILQQYALLPVFRSLNEEEMNTLKENFPSLRFFILTKHKMETPHINSIAPLIHSDKLSRDEINSLFSHFIFSENKSDTIKFIHESFITLSSWGSFSGNEGVFQIAPSKKVEFSILGAQNRITHLEKEIRKIQNKINTFENTISKIENEKIEIERIYELLISELNTIIQNKIVTQGELDKIHYEYRHKKIESEKQNQLQARLIDSLKKTEHSLQIFDANYQAKTSTLKQYEEKINQLRLEHASQSKTVILSKEHYYFDKLHFQDLKTNIHSNHELLKHELAFLKKAEQDIEHKKNEIDSLYSTILNMKSESKNRQKIMSEIQIEHENLLGKKLRIEEHFRILREQIQEMEADSKATQKRREKFLDSVQKIELRLKELSIKSQTITERIFHDYQINITEIEISEQFEILKIEQEVYLIKNKIAKLGEVNALAVEDYKKENERLNFLTQQHDDLVSAEAMLLDTINTINKTAKEIFDKVFEQIRLNFQLVYKQFFALGEADLELVNKNDPLESYIDIKVSPKGRSLQTLALLSGGEKTLTAISLLFSIYLVKPSPFCILDEVDAPLDDANILRFTTALKTFTDRTQFIVITHNKRTMEASDYMYGVTQEESGISKLVSINFVE